MNGPTTYVFFVWWFSELGNTLLDFDAQMYHTSRQHNIEEPDVFSLQQPIILVRSWNTHWRASLTIS